ncbi:hypothetical protein QE152_g31900 [Popillia japonica]|uniref:Uncharacterized protein n=1 Tax=Popillia japonica TaxID=7064 RepID=A0AAW1J1G0_POPJA
MHFLSAGYLPCLPILGRPESYDVRINFNIEGVNRNFNNSDHLNSNYLCITDFANNTRFSFYDIFHDCICID